MTNQERIRAFLTPFIGFDKVKEYVGGLNSMDKESILLFIRTIKSPTHTLFGQKWFHHGWETSIYYSWSPEEQIEIWELIAQKDTNSGFGYVALAKSLLHFNTRTLTEVFDIYEKAISINPDHLITMNQSEMTRFREDPSTRLRMLEVEIGFFKKAIKEEEYSENLHFFYESYGQEKEIQTIIENSFN